MYIILEGGRPPRPTNDYPGGGWLCMIDELKIRGEIYGAEEGLYLAYATQTSTLVLYRRHLNTSHYHYLERACMT